MGGVNGVVGGGLVKDGYIKNKRMSWFLMITEKLKGKKGLACLGLQGESLPRTLSCA